jgi:hypothetical protein
LILNRTGAQADTYKYVNYNGEMQTVASLNNPDLDLKNEWNAVNPTSPRKLISYFDIANQLVAPLNMAKWESILDKQVANGMLGISPLYTYDVANKTILQT